MASISHTHQVSALLEPPQAKQLSHLLPPVSWPFYSGRMEIPNIPGLDFDPTAIQILSHYLKPRILDYFNPRSPSYSTNRHLIPDIELYNWDPDELPSQHRRLSEVRSNGSQWFFFCLRKEKYLNSSRSERTVAGVGYWKITGTDTKVMSEGSGEEIGKKTTLTFYRGRIPNGIMTNWGMHEYRLNPSCLGCNNNKEMPYVVCRVFKRSGRNNKEPSKPATSVGSRSAA